MKHLLFLFRGHFQSWGTDACKNQRTTLDRPTKSGAIGYLSLCAGLPRGDQLIFELNSSLGFACRVDEPGKMVTEYSTFSIGPYDIQDDSKIDFEAQRETKEIYKHCMENATFTVCVWEKTELDVLYDLCKAILTPVFIPYLGRRAYPFSCLPMPKIIEAEDVQEAFKKYGHGVVHRMKKTIYIEGVGLNTQYVMDSAFKNRGFRKRPEYSVLEGA